MKFVAFIFSSLLFLNTNAQVNEPISNNAEQQLENNTAINEDASTEDDSYLQQMQDLLKHPINLNTAQLEELFQLRILSSIQIQQFFIYRKLIGKFIDIYELQAIPSWDVITIQKIKPFIFIGEKIEVKNSLKERLNNGEHTILLRASQVLEKSKGHLINGASATNFYPGSPQKYFFRYRYNYKNILQYGIVADKDAGEQFFKGKQKQGFDFYSGHFALKNLGVIHSLVIGDYTVNLGQGLIQWQNLAFKKSADVMNIKRESTVIRPYNSAGEINFHRGLGLTLKRNKLMLTSFVSYKKIDANFVADTSQNQMDYVSSLQTSGYHRTKSEIEDKGIQKQFSFGGNMSYQFQKLKIGINGIHYFFKLPLIKSTQPYNKYALSGKSFGDYSIDYNLSFKNLHLFGELAISSTNKLALVNGLLVSVSSFADVSILYRNISKAYQSLYSNAFTENTNPSNENGLYTGISIRPNQAWKIDAYTDFYKFPWLKYRVDAPSNGSDYFVQATFKPNKEFEIYTRYHAEKKSINRNVENLPFSELVEQPRKNWRTQISYKIDQAITLRSRTEVIWFDKRGTTAENGFLLFFDALYRPLLKPYSGGIRVQYFETDGYNSRIYAYENDVLYYFSIPVFYDKGLRYYININYDLSKKLSFWIKYAQTLYKGKNIIGTGLDEIKGSKKSELRMQLLLRF